MFLLCAEGFTSLLAKAEEDGRLHGVSICQTTPRISNLMFADDSFLFYQANQEEVQVISDALKLYAMASRQCNNLDKSSVFFSSNTTGAQRDCIANALGGEGSGKV